MTAGLKTLLLLIIRRDRIKLPLSIILFVASLLAMVPLLLNVYGDAESQRALQASFGTNPAGLFMVGPIDEPTFGALFTVETLLWWGLVLAFINTLLVVRHTRHNEEIGAQELILSGQTHRGTSLVAVLLAAIVMNGLIVLGIGAGLPLLDVTWSVDQSWLYALVLGGFGLVWACIAAVVVQLVESGRAANGLLAALIGIGYITRGVGDFLGHVDAAGVHQPAWMSWLSPFGWMQAARPLTDPEWWPLAVPLGVGVAMAAAAFVLLEQRDVGAGLLPSRKGHARAARFLRTPLGLTWKLQKNIFIGWLIGVLVTTSSIGVLVPQMEEVYSSTGNLEQLIESIGGAGELMPSFMSAMISIMSLLVFAYVLQGLGQLRSEEASGHLEQLLATRLTRLKWQALHVGMVMCGGLVMLLGIGAVLALFINTTDGMQADTAEYLLAGLSYAPVMLALGALYLLLFGIVPRAAGGVAWLYFGFMAFMSWLGPMLKLDDWIMSLSVMDHLALPPVEDIKVAPIVTLLIASIIMGIVGMAAWRQRNLIEK